MISKLSLNIQVIWVMFQQTSILATQVEKWKYCVWWNDCWQSVKLFLQNLSHNYLSVEEISLAFTTKSYFFVLKVVLLNSINYFFLKISSKHELPQIAWNRSCDIDCDYFMEISEENMKKLTLFLFI